MVHLDRRAGLRGLAGFLAGLTMWALLSPVYDAAVARAAQTVLRTFERPAVTRLPMAPDNYVTVDREDFDRRSKRPAIPVRDLTFNFILLLTLFALEARPLADRNIGRLVLASLLLAITHVLAVVTEVMSIYVLKLGPWSRVHYTDLERSGWGVASHSYRLVLMYAIAFALWWICRPGPAAAPATPAQRKKRVRR